jgi:carbamate kinase
MPEQDPGSPSRRFVIALGGNAIIPSGRRGTFDEQLVLTRQTMDQVAELSRDGHEIVLTHGNGPVVGNIVLRNAAGLEKHGIPAMPLYVCGADSQGGIGFMIQQALQNSLRAYGLHRPVAALVTQVIVDSDDPAFEHPTKPIGPFYSAEQAAQLRRENGWTVVEDAHRGWRRVVPSPQPIEVVEWEAIRAMIRAGIIAIAVGGGGVPVARDAAGELHGVDAVIDKDRASALLGKLIGADTLVIVTSVERVFRAFGTPQAQPLSRLKVSDAAQMLDAGEFPAGSMGPKIEAALAFLAGGGERVLITGSGSILRGLDGKTGTWIEPD